MTTTPSPISGRVALTHWGVIRAHGADAASFLHSQLTNDFSTLAPGQARLAGYCSPKGRLLASFLAWRAGPDDILLACHASVLPPALKRLSMFVLRAKCKLSDASADVRLQGLAGGEVTEGGVTWEVRDVPGGHWIRLPDAHGVPRAILATTDAAAPDAGLSLDTWRWLDVQSGIAGIESATVEQFVPQMLNHELVGSVSFKKGCYPGQEIVARSQYRGTIKRRTFLFDVDAAASPGQEVFHSEDPGQPAGMVVNAAPRPDGTGASALVEAKLSAIDSGSLHLGVPGGPALQRRDLPYPLPLDADQPA